MDIVKVLPVDELVAESLKHEQVDCPVKHTFAPGQYIRELTLPADTLVVGFKHRFKNTNIFVKGSLKLLQADGSVKELHAPMTFVAEPGSKVAVTLTECVWINVFNTDERDINTLEDIFFDKPDELKKTLGQTGVKALIGYEELEPMPMGTYCYKLTGDGVKATGNILPGEQIGLFKKGNKFTEIGLNVRTSLEPNAEVIEYNGDLYLDAVIMIKGCKGGRDGDEITIKASEV